MLTNLICFACWCVLVLVLWCLPPFWLISLIYCSNREQREDENVIDIESVELGQICATENAPM